MADIAGVDYSYDRPDPAQMKKAGVRFAVRYVTPPGKNAKGLDQAEFDALRAVGIYVVAVWETGAKAPLKGRTQGVRDARDAQAGLERIVGLPDRAPVYFAVDWDASDAEMRGRVREYFQGVASVLGVERTGVYGGGRQVAAVHGAGGAFWVWQTYAWSGGGVYPHAHLHQYSNDHRLYGGTVDLVRALQPEYGQHAVAARTPEKEKEKEKPAAPAAQPVQEPASKPEGTVMHARGFKVSGRYAFSLPKGVAGKGRTATGTILRVDDHTSTSGKLVPRRAGSTNPLYVLRTTASSGVAITGVVVDGGVQGHLYNGVRVEKTKAPTVSEVKVVRVPGDDDVPPGETFGINYWRATGPVTHDVEIDGAGVGASGLGLNSCSGGSTTRLTAHDHPHCKAVALWQHSGGHAFDRVESLNNAFAFGFERCTGTYTLTACKFVGSARADVHLASDKGRAKVVIRDPQLRPGQKVKVLLPKLEMGRPNLQKKEDITVFVGGKERRDLLVFVDRA